MISEKNILSNLDHPFIVRLSGTFQGMQEITIHRLIFQNVFVISFLLLDRCEVSVHVP